MLRGELAERLGAHRMFESNELLPQIRGGHRRYRTCVTGAFDGVLSRSGTIVITGLTTGHEAKLSLIPMLADQITQHGSIREMLEKMQRINLIVSAGIKPEMSRNSTSFEGDSIL